MQLLNIAVFLPLVSAYAIPLDTRATTSNPCAIVANYTVVSGDTLSKIATAYNSTVDAIVYVNPSITNANLIYPDEVIAIPSSDCNSVAPAVDVATEGTNTCAPAGTAANYTVKSGDTLTDIASSYNLTLAALEAANPQIANFDVIDVGQVINIPVCEACTPTYTIKSGDTLTNIASSYGITLAALEAANPQIANFDLIYPDQVINIPCTATCTSTYTVVSGDYLSKIADNHNVTLAALEAANPQIANFDLIQPGDVINIPTTCAATSNTCTSTYTVVSGDYLSKIADNHNVTLAALEAANPQIANFDLIQPGDVINIPTTCAATTPVVTGTCAPAGTAATYTVKSGDYLSLIASNYNITLAALEAVNPQIANFDLIQPGDVINIPVCGSTAESTTSTGDDVCE